jgi:phosphatidylserine/phosphatidylglycerophosphate/cardiolipin synthase-like enzyme
MPAFVPPFNRTAVQYVDDVIVELPDPAHTPLDPIVRPSVARYAGRKLVLMHVRPLASAFDLRSPAIGTARRVNLPAVLTGANELLEIEPLPFRIAASLQKLPPGSPTFYVASSSGLGSAADGDLLESGATIVNASGDVYAGVLFQDGAALSPWAWIELLGRAMQESGDSSGATAWNDLAVLYSGLGRTVRVLDHDGRPAGAGLAFNVSINGQPPVTLTTSAASELTLSAGTVGISWQGSPLTGDTALPVQAVYERTLAAPANANLSAPPGELITLPSEFVRGHLQALDLSRWYAVPPFDTIAARYHANCRVEPLLDGVATFKRIVNDLLASAAAGGSAYFSGLIFNKFDLDKGRKDPESPGDDLDTTLIGLTNYLRGRDAEVRMQFDKFIKPKDPAQLTNVVQTAAFAVVTVAASAVTLLSLIDKFRKSFPTDEVGFLMMWGLEILSVKLVTLLTVSRLEDVIEPSIDIFKELNQIENHLAIWARHPVRMADNPLADRDLLPGLKIEDIQEKFGSWHQKIQAITRVTPDSQGNRIVGYVGGIDINKNRLDTPGHQAAAPYHDVHSRVTGTAAFDVHQTWRERYDFEKEQHVMIDGDNTVPDLVTPLPDYHVTPGEYPAHPQKHLVQIGRTYFQASGGGPALPFSTIGERTTYDTYLRAIKAARTYIHLEDQYFTPNTSTLLDNPPGTRHPEVFLDVLLDAAVTCKRLVVMLPREGDQPFGQHRRAFVISKLHAAWGDRMFIGVPLRRPLLPEPGVVASKGRARLLEDIAETAAGPLLVGPHVRVPEKPPFWLWIYGELMLCTHVENDVDAEQLPARRMTVVRGGDWGGKPRGHKRGAPVTFSQLRGPYVHAKVVMVDDMFLGIGTTNLTRRAFFHEGEIHAFAVPEQLRAAPDNPAFSLRTALWAEHLGLPPSLGPSLLGDPMAAFEYFRRSMFGGNRSVPVEVVNERPHMGGSFDEDSITGALKNLLGISVAAIVEPFWNTFSDATTTLDPQPLQGPLE